MSPSSELSPQSSKLPAVEQPSLNAETSASPELSDASAISETTSEGATDASQENPPVLRKPPTRPVSKPQPPATAPSVAPKPPTSLAAPKPPAPAKPPEVVQPVENDEAAQAQMSLRQQPIPPPSEPKQYRAIGLVRGRYTPSEEEFTRGEMLTADGTILKSVLLGRVMSLVKNHVDLTIEHLWVVYPRTRDVDGKELNLQIVGIWEPETLKKEQMESEDGEEGAAKPLEIEPSDSPNLQDGYFSIRGEIVFFSEEESHIVVKIQQAPRKSSQKAKAFKVSLKGVVNNPKAVGYFWDFHIKLQADDLVVTEAAYIGLAPPKKRMPGDTGPPRRSGGPRRPPMGGGRRGAVGGGGGGSRGARPGAPRPAGSAPREGVTPREGAPPREGAVPKPIVKRNSEPTAEA